MVDAPVGLAAPRLNGIAMWIGTAVTLKCQLALVLLRGNADLAQVGLAGSASTALGQFGISALGVVPAAIAVNARLAA